MTDAANDDRELTELLGAHGLDLTDPDLWVQPPPELADRVVGAVAAAASDSSPRRWYLGVAAAAALIMLIVGVWAAFRSPGADWEIALQPTEYAPGATATVQGWNRTGGTRLVLAADGLPEPPAGFAYHLWFTGDGEHVSAGTFGAADEVELSIGVSRRDYPLVWVTVEPLGAPMPGETVLISG